MQSEFDTNEELKEKLGNAITDLSLDDDDDGEAAVMEDSDLEDEEDEVNSKHFYYSNKK